MSASIRIQDLAGGSGCPWGTCGAKGLRLPGVHSGRDRAHPAGLAKQSGQPALAGRARGRRAQSQPAGARKPGGARETPAARRVGGLLAHRRAGAVPATASPTSAVRGADSCPYGGLGRKVGTTFRAMSACEGARANGDRGVQGGGAGLLRDERRIEGGVPLVEPPRLE